MSVIIAVLFSLDDYPRNIRKVLIVVVASAH